MAATLTQLEDFDRIILIFQNYRVAIGGRVVMRQENPQANWRRTGMWRAQAGESISRWGAETAQKVSIVRGF